MLLLPLGIHPKWVTSTSNVSHCVYYGSNPENLTPETVVIPLQEDTCRFFEDRRPYEASRAQWREHEADRYPVLFGGTGPAGDDLVASTFFWLSGWQEYTISNRDQHGRFPFAASLQSELGTARAPTVDIYREVLKHQLQRRSIPVRERTWGGKDWAFCPTHDIDYVKKWRPGMMYREVVERFLTNSAGESPNGRLRRLCRFVSDVVRPGDVFRSSFTRMIDEIEKRGGSATYFVKAGAHGPHDVFYSPSSGYLRRMLARLKEGGFEVGLHPSYYAHTHAGYLAGEKERLESALGAEVTSVRQHYLRYELPQTLRLHVEAGFKIDSTLAFAEQEGFRNGTCHPFLRYDILSNEATDSWEMPLCFMDGTLFNYRNLDLEPALEASRQLIRICKKYRGACVALWHNTLWDEMDFPGWGAHFLKTMDFVLQQDGRIDSLQNSLKAYLDAG